MASAVLGAQVSPPTVINGLRYFKWDELNDPKDSIQREQVSVLAQWTEGDARDPASGKKIPKIRSRYLYGKPIPAQGVLLEQRELQPHEVLAYASEEDVSTVMGQHPEVLFAWVRWSSAETSASAATSVAVANFIVNHVAGANAAYVLFENQNAREKRHVLVPLRTVNGSLMTNFAITQFPSGITRATLTLVAVREGSDPAPVLELPTTFKLNRGSLPMIVLNKCVVKPCKDADSIVEY